jgi:hypothetical protein
MIKCDIEISRRHSRILHPVHDLSEYPLVVLPCIIEARCINENNRMHQAFGFPRLDDIGFNSRGTGVQVMANRGHILQSGRIDKLTLEF